MFSTRHSACATARRISRHRGRSAAGVKTLISHNYYGEDEFWQIFNKRNYDAVKAITDPKNLFRDLYTKTAPRWGL
jgi:hypothetical protein